MNLPANLFSPAFGRERLGFILALLLAIMVFLGSLAMAAQAVLARTSTAWSHDLHSRLTLEISSAPDEGADKREEGARQAASILLARNDVAEVKILPETETRRLLSPWISDSALLDSLALPRLVDVELAAGVKADPAALRQALAPLGAEVALHRNEQGMAELAGFLKGLGALAWIMLGLTGLSLVLIVWLICRAAMSVQRETIELMHYMGASDAVVASQFQSYVRRLSLPAAVCGFLAAGGSVAALFYLIGRLGGLSLVAPVSWMTVGGMMALVPVAASCLAILTARVSVQRVLRRML